MKNSNQEKKTFLQKVKYMYVDSVKELKVTNNLVLCAMMAALSIVLSVTTSYYITPEIKVGFSGLPNRLVDFMFGPSVGCFFGGMMDLIKFFIKPDGVFFFGYTLTAMVAGLIYGTFFYNLQIKVPVKQLEEEQNASGKKRPRWMLWFLANVKTILLIFIAEVLVKLLCNCGLNTLWSSMFTGKAYLALLPLRLTKNLIQIPVDTVLHFCVIMLFQKMHRYLVRE